MTETVRLGLPLIEAGQAQKEIAHNEALALLDLAVQPSVAAVGIDVPPADPAAGQAWIVGTAPTGAWNGRAGALAGWSGGGWRFVAPWAGLMVWSIADAAPVRYDGAAWRIAAPHPAIAGPTGGGVVDAEARATLAAVLTALRAHRLIAV